VTSWRLMMFSLPAWMPGRELRQGDGDDVAEEGAAAHGRSQDPNGSLAVDRQQRPFGPPSWRERPIAHGTPVRILRAWYGRCRGTS
jgi:hypothetical protein